MFITIIQVSINCETLPKILTLARALDVLPPKIFIVGCQPEDCGEYGAEMSGAVKRAVPLAVERVKSPVSGLCRETAASGK